MKYLSIFHFHLVTQINIYIILFYLAFINKDKTILVLTCVIKWKVPSIDDHSYFDKNYLSNIFF